jgi:hypothetical protein
VSKEGKKRTKGDFHCIKLTTRLTRYSQGFSRAVAGTVPLAPDRAIARWTYGGIWP